MSKKLTCIFLSVAIFFSCLIASGVNASAIETGTTGDCVWSYDYSTQTLIVSGSGKMADYSFDYGDYYDNNIDTNHPWSDNVKKVIIEKGVAHIGKASFAGCDKLTEVSTNASVTSIGDYAFIETGLKSYTFPKNIKTIGYYSVGSCLEYDSDLEDYGLSTVKNFKCYGYYNNRVSLNYAIKYGFEYIDPDNPSKVMFGYKKLSGNKAEITGGYNLQATLKIPSKIDGRTVTRISDEAFFDKQKIKNLTIPSTVTYIGDNAFLSCDNLKTAKVYAKNCKNDIGEAFDSDYFNKKLVIYVYTNSITHNNFTWAGITYKVKSLGGMIVSVPRLKRNGYYETNIYAKGTRKIKVKKKGISGKIKYKSSNKKVAKISSKGKITALKKGSAWITVKCGSSFKYEFKCYVNNPKLNAQKKTLGIGKTFKLKIKGKVGKATFKSSNNSVASVSKAGVIKANYFGKATITVKTNGIKLKCKIKVK